MAVGKVASGLPVGPNRGFIVTKRELPSRPQARRKQNPRVKVIREVIREVCGFAPYERRIMELLKVGTPATNKRALKLAKKRLGTHKRGKNKREAMSRVIMQQRRRQAASAGHH